MAGIINGRPTKQFFVNMITRDITIREAILDLLDNSIDGASRLNPDDYSGLYVHITANKDEFILEDNCGGFSLNIAQKYAFRFGRPDEAELTKGSIGRFGIGMKRALFKMGKSFEVESKTEEDHFQVDVNQDDWLNKKETVKRGEIEEDIDDWSFDYVEINDSNKNLEAPGTYIRVGELENDVASEFNDNAFLVGLEDDIEKLLNFSLEKGIKITLNGKKLKKKNIEIFNDTSKPYCHNFEKGGVHYKICAGLGKTGEPGNAGWYIYCNDRLVVSANKDHNTSWGIDNIPRFNNDFAMFRGVVYLNSDDPLKLPLTTTKKGIDTSSEVYKILAFFMKESMLSVIGFLKDARKLENANEYRKLLGEQQDAFLNIIALKHHATEGSRKFIMPPLDYEEIAKKPKHVRIAFSADRSFAEKVKNHSGSKNFTALGEYLFDYYVKMEEVENE